MLDLDLRSIAIIAGGGEVALPLVLGLALVFALIYAGATAKPKGERRRRGDLAWVSLLAGPTVGAVIAWVFIHLTQVSPLDIGYSYGTHVGIGLLVGLIVGFAFLITAGLAPGEAGKPPFDPDFRP